MTALCPRCGASDPTGQLALCPRCFLAADDVDPKPRIPGLELESEAGRGGMGRVYRARHVGLGREVAVKVLPAELAEDPEFRARFEREARVLARLDHPGIVRVHDSGVSEDGQFYLVMEWAGGSLRDHLPLSHARAVEIACRICDALAHAHAQGVVHRDIKPENVLLDEHDRVRLTDFGIARLLAPEGEGGTVTRASRVFGTPDYMAPEARAGLRPDVRMDIYAVGALLLYMLTGSAEDSALTGLPSHLAAIVRRAKAWDPASRPATAIALRGELERSLRTLQTTRSDEFDELPPEERTWSVAVALLSAVATAIALYAFVASFMPRTLAPEQTLPGLMTFGDEPLPDGRILTRARFEIGPILGATVAIAVALLAYGLLRRHWRQAGFEVPRAEQRLPGSRRVFALGSFLFAAFLMRQLLADTGLRGVVAYLPVLGGVLELMMLFFFFGVTLEAQRVSRPLRREPLLWVGVALSLLPPVYQFFWLLQAGGAFLNGRP
jgi:serine/threonine-protein kinase